MDGEDGGAVIGATVQERAYIGPFAAFLALFALGSLVHGVWEGQAYWIVAAPEYWLYPLQAAVSGGLLLLWRREYESFHPSRVSWTVAIGLLALAVWIAPQAVFHFAPRTTGFDPGHFGPGVPYGVNLGLRLIRAVIVVPIVEELFWRGFLLRFLIAPDFRNVLFGTFSWLSFSAVTLGFCFEHQPADWAAAALTGAIYNLVAYRTRSLGSCILAHAVTNAGLCAYILATRQWGFW